MTDPILVEVTRGNQVESRHRGAIAVCDAAGGLVLSLGDVDQPVFPRSAVKAIQALPLVESGIADKLGFSAAEIALACASHSGEPEHVATAAGMLAKVGRGEPCLECGAHWPREPHGFRLAATGATPSQLHNNCSGKHAGFVCLSCGHGEDPIGYVGYDHPVQVRVRAALSEVCGVTLDRSNAGTDGCSIPSYAIPLRALAQGFARFGTGESLPAGRREAAAKIRAAVAQSPFHVAGTGRFDTRAMDLLGMRLFVKTGAEGVHCAALPELGLGIAVKCDDGAGRCAEILMATMVQRFLKPEGAQAEGLAAMARPVLKNWNGIEVGVVRPAAALIAT